MGTGSFLRKLLQIGTDLLQIVAAITNRGNYCKSVYNSSKLL